ncbi:hypothetical protein X941_4456 [Burkholderia pseudomallei MSHR5569]|nr:hypothetical protein X941_4456 [Burkholderia pseudomallei MSHR5569]
MIFIYWKSGIKPCHIAFRSRPPIPISVVTRTIKEDSDMQCLTTSHAVIFMQPPQNSVLLVFRNDINIKSVGGCETITHGLILLSGAGHRGSLFNKVKCPGQATFGACSPSGNPGNPGIHCDA